MKTISIITVALFPLFSYGAEKIDPIYALDCPGAAKLALSVRHDLKNEGIELPWDPIPAPGDPRDYFMKQYGRRWSDLLKVHYFDGAYADVVHNWSDGIDWQKDIQIQPAGVGLPEQIDGCTVIPLLVSNPAHEINSINKRYLGNETDLLRLDRFDRILAYALLNPGGRQLLKFVFKEPSAVAKTPRERAAMLATAGHDSFFYSVGSHRNSFKYELTACTWWATGYPRECISDQSRRGSVWVGNTGPNAIQISFYPTGVLQSGNINDGWGHVRRSQNPDSPLFEKLVTKCIRFTYYASGYLKECWRDAYGGPVKQEFSDGEDGQ